MEVSWFYYAKPQNMDLKRKKRLPKQDKINHWVLSSGQPIYFLMADDVLESWPI